MEAQPIPKTRKPPEVLNQLKLEALKFTGKQAEHYDVACRGLALRVSARTRTWVFSGRVGGRSKRFTLGAYPGMTLKAARVAAEEVRDLLKRGEDPSAIRRAKDQKTADERSNTFGAVTELFLAQRIRPHCRPKTTEHYEDLLKSSHLANWQDRPIAAIDEADVQGVIDRFESAGRHVAARAMRGALKTLFKWGMLRKKLSANPAAGVELIREAKDLARERFLALPELAQIWHATEGGIRNIATRNYYRFLILTALRRNEASLIKWSWLDLASAEPTLTIPKTATKNKRDHVVPLTSTMIALIEELPRAGDEAFVFSSDGGATRVRGFSKNKIALDRQLLAANEKAKAEAKAKLKGAQLQEALRQIGEPLSDWRLHDFRRSFSSYCNEHELASGDVIEMALGHVAFRAGIREVYDRSRRMGQRRLLMEAWSEAVMAAVDGRAAQPLAKVVAIR